MNTADITVLLQRMGMGDEQAHHELLERVYDELRSIAGSKLRHDPAQRSWSATALVHEAWMRITPPDGSSVQWSNRRHFFAAAAEAMRRILVEQARRRKAKKRERPAPDSLPPEVLRAPELPIELDLMALDEALTEFRQIDPQAAAVVEMRFFTGLELQEIADLLELSRATVVRELTFAKSWLRARMDDE